MINTDILSRTVSNLSQIIFFNLGFFAFSTPLVGLRTTYTVHSRLMGKLVVDFLFVLSKLFSLGVMAEAPQASIDWKSRF